MYLPKGEPSMFKKPSIVMAIFAVMLMSQFTPSYAIPVDLSGSTLVTGPYPYTHDDSLGLIGTSDDGLGNPNDIDYYKFWANVGDALTIDIDNGFDGRDDGDITPGFDIDVLLTLFHNDVSGFIPYSTFGNNPQGAPNADDAGSNIDPGSYITNPFTIAYTKDPFISYGIATSGFYYLAVSITDNHYTISSDAFTGVSTPGEFPEGGTYTLIIDGVSTREVPEPSTLLFLVIGLPVLIVLRNKRIVSSLNPR